MYTVYQLVSRIPLPTSLTLGHLPPGGRVNSPINGNLLAHKKPGLRDVSARERG